MIAKALQYGEAYLSPTSDAPRLDAERLLLFVVGQTESAWLYAHSDQQLSAEQDQQYRELLAARATGKPLAYILGEWEFYGRPFFITPDVLVPRPETENLIDAALSHIRSTYRYVDLSQGPYVLADVGTGSGCIAITLACELAKFEIRNSSLRQGFGRQAIFEILATDISPAALAVARRNAERHGVADQIEFLEGDMLSPLTDRKIDLIVSNPPYLPSAELDRPVPRGVQGKLETQGLRFEPRIALDGGPNGQQFIEQIKNAGIPALVEGTGGDVTFFPKKPSPG